jgi:hypothetical protein
LTVCFGAADFLDDTDLADIVTDLASTDFYALDLLDYEGETLAYRPLLAGNGFSDGMFWTTSVLTIDPFDIGMLLILSSLIDELLLGSAISLFMGSSKSILMSLAMMASYWAGESSFFIFSYLTGTPLKSFSTSALSFSIYNLSFSCCSFFSFSLATSNFLFTYLVFIDETILALDLFWVGV